MNFGRWFRRAGKGIGGVWFGGGSGGGGRSGSGGWTGGAGWGGAEMLVLFGDPLTITGYGVDEVVGRGFWVAMAGPQPFYLAGYGVREVDEAVGGAMLGPAGIWDAGVGVWLDGMALHWN